MKRRTVAAVGVWNGLVAGACFATDPGWVSQQECNDDLGYSCPEGSLCVDFRCYRICEYSSECESAEACLDSLCQPYSQSCDEHTPDPCAEGYACDVAAKACRRKLPSGSLCRSDGVCDSGHCVDGICCDQACTGICQTCLGAYSSGSAEDDGWCRPVGVGLDPDADCAGGTGCDGTGACFAVPQGVSCQHDYECQTGFCADGVCCNTACGTCQVCFGGSCEAIMNGGDPLNECAGTLTCNGQGACWASPLGASCANDFECVGGHCVDGYCCATACDGPCERCDAWGSCGPVVSAEDLGTCDFQTMAGPCVLAPCVCDAGSSCRSAGGVACLSDVQCVSNACLGGTCCNEYCTGGCFSCNALQTGAPAGECWPVLAHADPREACPGMLTCDGEGACFPPWAGVEQFGSDGTDEAGAMAVSMPAQRIWVAGSSTGEIAGGPVVGEADMFVSGLDFSGNRLWTTGVGTAGGDAVSDLAIDGAGNPVFCGRVEGDLPGSASLGASDGVLIKLDSLGVVQWTTRFGTPQADSCEAVAVGANGEIFVAGFTYGDLEGSGNLGDDDAFIAKFDSVGTVLWARQFGTSGYDQATAIAQTPSGDIVVGGDTSGELRPGGSVGYHDIFLAGFGADGETVFLDQLGSTLSDDTRQLFVTDAGDIFLLGQSKGSVLGQSHYGAHDLIVAKYDAGFIRQWVYQYGTSDADEPAGIVVESDNEIVVAATTEGSFNGGPSYGHSDSLIFKLDAQGSLIWSNQLGTGLTENTADLDIDGEGNWYLLGTTYGAFEGTTHFYGADLFVAKLDENGQLD